MDETDILLVAGGNSEAFERIVKRNQRRIKCWFLSQLHSDSDADDYTQETFIRVFISAGTYMPGSFRSWLYRIARNYLIDQCRRAHTRIEVVDPDRYSGMDEPTEWWLAVDCVDPHEQAERSESIRMLDSVIDTIPRDQADALRTYAEGWSLPEIAEMADCCTATIKGRLRLARQKIREQIGEKRFLEAVG